MDNDAERKSMMSRAIPARPKGASGPPGSEYPVPTPPPPLDDLLKRRQSKLQFTEDEDHPMARGTFAAEPDPFVCFAEIIHMLKKLPKAQQRAMIALIAELLTE